MTPIERALFQDHGVHWIYAFELSPDAITLSLHPSTAPEATTPPSSACTFARFIRPSVVSIDDYSDDEGLEFPWDIIGFESEPLSDGRWRFCLHTDLIEYTFESAWPEITKPKGSRLDIA